MILCSTGRDRKTPLSPRFILDGFYGALDQIDIDEEERQARRITFHSHRHFLNTALRVGPGSRYTRAASHRTRHAGNDGALLTLRA